MVARESVQGEPRRNSSELAACISRIASERDQSAFELLFRYFAPRIKSYCLKLGADASEAEEITQEAMVSLWRNAEQFDPSKAAPSTWVFTIARNLVIDRFRKSRRPQFDFNDPALVPEDQPPPDRLIEQTELQENVRQIMDTLSSNERDVLLLSFFENLSHFEISRRLSLPVGTVKSRIRLAFGKIRSKLEAQGAGK
jgi:RNA polymerase sigma-70 factor (ECF subfamily)